MKIKTQTAMLMLVVTSTLWSLGGLFIKLIPWNPLVIAGWRSAIATVIFLVFIKTKGFRLKLDRRIVFSGLMLCLTMLFFVAANKLTTSANAIIIQSTAPVHIVIISMIFFKQRYSRREYIVVFVTLVGISLFFLDKLSPGGRLGNIIALLSGITFAFMYVYTNKLPDESSALSAMLLGNVLTAMIGIPFSFLLPTEIDSQAVLSIVILGVFQLGIPYILYGLAIRNCLPLYGSLIGLLEPIFNPLWVFLFVGERPGLYSIIGGTIVLVTVGTWCGVNAVRREKQRQ